MACIEGIANRFCAFHAIHIHLNFSSLRKEKKAKEKKKRKKKKKRKGRNKEVVNKMVGMELLR